MNSRINEWLQIVAALGVFAGLILVAYEIRETNKLALSESVRELQRTFIDVAISEFESDIYGAYVKSFENAEDLTSKEIMQLSAWLSAQMSLYGMWNDMYQLGRSRNDGTEDLIGQFDYFFGSKFGRTWYSLNRSWIAPELLEVIDRELESRPVLTMPASIEEIRSQLRTSGN